MITGPWLRRLPPGDGSAPARLVCFPHAGGSATAYLPLSRSLASRVEVVGVQNPGRQERYAEPRLESIAELADGVLPSIRKALDRPTALFGHSMGAVQAFEVVRRLEQEGLSVAALFVSARRAPARYRAEAVHRRPDAGLISEMRLLGGTDGRIFDDQEMARMYLSVVRSDYTAVETYRCEPGVRVSCPIVAVTGDRDPRVPVGEVREWAGHTAAGFRIRVLPGGHFYLTEHAATVATLVDEVLGET
ncbi:thioesterase II family protein [Nocardia sp. alder85J]|uniref:thioesterase II family protein n=1 Tax=Nocardia sp. alder85J TaxID=2862949 RepID=UPI001CD6E7B5|nr:alpha/beta fold hydrolase [Nocardia sp. alder85J]MCX4098262.1 alpha/beta fold hydrolase [Nocardia sp. alder85J]